MPEGGQALEISSGGARRLVACGSEIEEVEDWIAYQSELGPGELGGG